MGNTANEIACKTQNEILSKQKPGLKDILILNIYSGVIWWSDLEVQKQFNDNPKKIIMDLETKLLNLAKQDLSIDDFHEFINEILNVNSSTQIIYFPDDNGEFVWDLLFMHNIIKTNKNINFVCVVHDDPISNTANYSTLSYLFENNKDCYIEELKNESRFKVLREVNKITAFDPRFMSENLIQEIQTSNMVISKGASNFEKLQYVPIPIYYLFTVYSKISTILTGLK